MVEGAGTKRKRGTNHPATSLPGVSPTPKKSKTNGSLTSPSSTTSENDSSTLKQNVHILKEQKKNLMVIRDELKERVAEVEAKNEKLKVERMNADKSIGLVSRYWNNLLTDLKLFCTRLPNISSNQQLQQVSTSSLPTDNSFNNETNTNNTSNSHTPIANINNNHTNNTNNNNNNTASTTIVNTPTLPNHQNSSTFISQLLFEYDHIARDDDEKKIEAKLELKCSKIKEILTCIAEGIQMEKQRNDDILKKIKLESGHHKRDASICTLREDNNKLKALTENYEKTINELQVKYSRLSNEVESYKDKLNIAVKEIEELKNDVEDKSEKLADARKRIGRLNNKIADLNKLAENAANFGSSGSISPVTPLSSHTSSGSKFSMSEDSQRTIAELQNQIEQYKSLMLQKDAEIAEMNNSRVNLEKELEHMRLIQISEQYIRDSRTYRELYKLHQDLYDNFKEEMAKSERNTAEMCKLIAEKNELHEHFQGELESIRKAFEEKIEKKEEELKTLRAKVVCLEEKQQQQQQQGSHNMLNDQENYKKEYFNQKKELENARNQIQQYEKSKDEVYKDVENLRAKVTKYKDFLEKSNKKIKELTTLIDSYKTLDQEKRELAEIKGREAFCMNRIKRLEEELDKLKDSDVSKLHEELQQQKDDNDVLSGELDSMVALCQKYQDKVSKIEDVQKSRDDQIAQLMKEKSKLEKVLAAQETIKKDLEAKCKRAEDAHKLFFKDFQKFNELEVQYKRLLDEMNTLRRLEEGKKNLLLSSNLSLSETKSQLDKTSEALQSLKKKYDDTLDALKNETLKLKSKDDEIQLLKGKLNHVSSDMVNNDLQDDLKYFKSLVTCSQCQSNRKDCILIRCSHTFCKKCVNSNLQVRNRKCPQCKVGFGKDDVHDIYL